MPQQDRPIPDEPEGASAYVAAPPSADDGEIADLGAVYATPIPYGHWDTTTSLPDVSTATTRQLQDGLLQIVAVEGPVLGERLYQLYVRSSGGARVGSAVRRVLNRAAHELVQQGDLIVDDPLEEGGQVKKTHRLPVQPPFVVRDLGERAIHDVPPLELACRLRALQRPGEGQEQVFRRALDAYGLIRLSAATRSTLERAASLLDARA